MNSPAKILLNFINDYTGRDELLPMLRRIYITCVGSDMTDDWDGDTRMDFFYLIENLEELIPCIDELTEDLRPILKNLDEKYWVKLKEARKEDNS